MTNFSTIPRGSLIVDAKPITLKSTTLYFCMDTMRVDGLLRILGEMIGGKKDMPPSRMLGAVALHIEFGHLLAEL
jgi:hypothetical protein